MINKSPHKQSVVFLCFVAIYLLLPVYATAQTGERKIRIAVAEFWHETRTFSPHPTTIEDFEYYGPPTADILDTDRGFVGGFKIMIQELGGAELIGVTSPLYPGGDKTGGWVTRKAFDKYTGLIVRDLEAAGPFDGVYLSLHGGMAVTGIPKAEAEIVRRIRKVVGKIPIVVTIDLHANEDHELSDAADAVLALKRVPHYDTALQGERAARLLMKCIRGQYKPVMATRKPGVIVASVFQATDISPGMEIMERARKWENRHRDVYVSVVLGYAYADVPDAGVAVLVITNDDQVLADSIADDMSKYIRNVRKDLAGKQLPAPPEGVKQAIDAAASGATPVLIADHSDRTGASTHILEELIRQGAQNFCIATLRDGRAIKKISSGHKVGSRIQIEVGGYPGGVAGNPLPIEGTVDFIGDYQNKPIAVIRFGKANRIILSDGIMQVTSADIFPALGIDFQELDIIVVKSRVSFRRGFQETGIVRSIVLIDAPGDTPADLSTLPFKNIPEKSYPIYSGKSAAKIFEEGVISDGKNFALTFAPDGQSLYVTRREVLDDGTRVVDILQSRLQSGRWSIPEKASFNSNYRDADQFISPDGSKLFFMSERPLPGSTEKNDYDIWVAEKIGNGWGEPKHLGARINTHPIGYLPGPLRSRQICRAGESGQQYQY
jgi:microcystin degradation protein MlrC